MTKQLTNIETHLVDLIRNGDTVSGDQFSLSDIGDDCMDRFERFDWQYYVDSDFRKLWPSLSLETRLALTLIAQSKAVYLPK